MDDKTRARIAKYRKKYKTVTVYIPPETAAELKRRGYRLGGLFRELVKDFCKAQGIEWAPVLKGRRGRSRAEIDAAILDGVNVILPGEETPERVIVPAPEVEPSAPALIEYDLDFFL